MGHKTSAHIFVIFLCFLSPILAVGLYPFLLFLPDPEATNVMSLVSPYS